MLKWANAQWHEINGHVVLETGIDLRSMSVADGADLLYVLILRNKDEKEAKKIKSRLQLKAERSWYVHSKRRKKTEEEKKPAIDPKAQQLSILLGSFGGQTNMLTIDG